ncbi:MAG: alpha-galactosidase [Chloroflexi bacterium]|nr:alpha-galactosidase [Chloroflexota bacterium]
MNDVQSSEIGTMARWIERVCAGEGTARLGSGGEEGWLSCALPFSFRYGERESEELLPGWRRTIRRSAGNGRTVCALVLTDPSTGMEVDWEATSYVDVPAVEWLLSFRNTGANDTSLLEDIRALNLVLATDYHELMVYHGMGGIATAGAFEPRQTILPRHLGERVLERNQLRLAPVGGRSTNGDMPYFNVEANWGGYRGIVAAVGWSGQWEARISRFGAAPPLAVEPDNRIPQTQLSALRNATRLRIEAGMEQTHLILHAGERIRTPRIVLIPWVDDRQRAQNTLRRFIHQHVAPRENGAAPLPQLFSNLGIVDPTARSHFLALGETHLAMVPKIAALGVDYLVVDAGWYETPPPAPGGPASWSSGVGNYAVQKDVFPNGLRPLADEVRRHGMKFGLWFEPERVCEGTQVFREHRDWLLPAPVARGYIFDFGLPEARAWLTDTISGIIEDVGIGWYRHDANANYLPAWRSADSVDRQGITEIRYIEGLYQFWQELMDRHPGIVMEGCASGGRRMDIEALRYHHSYFHTDWFSGDPAAIQSHMHGGGHWLPGNYFNTYQGGTSSPTVDSRERRYAFFSMLGGAAIVSWRWFNEKEPPDLELGRRWLAEFRSLRHLAVGDFYPLLPHTLSEGQWLASQYHRPDLGEGMILAFRRQFCPRPTVRLLPRELDPKAIYRVTRQTSQEQRELRGRELLAGIEIHLDAAPAHEVIHYHQRRE